MLTVAPLSRYLSRAYSSLISPYRINIPTLLVYSAPCSRPQTPTSRRLLTARRIQFIVVSRFIVNLRRANEQESVASSPTEYFSRTSINFRMPTVASIIGSLGEPLDHAPSVEEEADVWDVDTVLPDDIEGSRGCDIYDLWTTRRCWPLASAHRYILEEITISTLAERNMHLLIRDRHSVHPFVLIKYVLSLSTKFKVYTTYINPNNRYF